jgi:hypothetical protein
MSHFSGHFEGASTFLTPKLGSKKSWPLKMSLKMAHKVIVPQKIQDWGWKKIRIRYPG